MKGLLLKDLYMANKYCRAFLLIVFVFIGSSFFGDNSIFFTTYPIMISGMIPVTLLGYDERSKWDQMAAMMPYSEYCETLPYSKAMIVSEKYLIGLILQICVIILSAISQAVRMNISNSFSLSSFMTLTALLIILSLITPSLIMPLMFKYGVEKGRIVYYITIGAFCAGIFAVQSLTKNNISEYTTKITGSYIFIILAACIALYAISWYTSVKFYSKREI